MTDLFNSGKQTPPIPDNALEALVGEGKKFKDVEALAKGKVMSDLHINELTAELAELRARLKGEEKLEELIGKLQKTPDTTPAAPAGGTPPSENTLTLDEVTKLLNERDRINTEQANLNRVASKLKELYGDDFSSKIDERAKQLGLDKDWLTGLAKTNPDGFINVMSPPATGTPSAQPKPNFSTPASSVNSQAIGKATGAGPEKGLSYYNKLYKENYRLWSSQGIQTEIANAVKTYGPAFLNS